MLAPACQAKTLEVGKGKTYALPSAAAAAAGSGDHIVIYPGQYFDCATLAASNLTVEGAGDPATVVLTDKTCGGKALLIVDGDDITIRQISRSPAPACRMATAPAYAPKAAT